MGFSILEAVVRMLQNAGIPADAAYPGQKYPAIKETSVAVHIEKVDRAKQSATVEVTVICPAERGGTQCELEALRITEVLRAAGAICVQNGCAYDGIAQVYCVDILAEFNCVTDKDSLLLGPGYQVYVNGVPLQRVTGFTAERYADSKLNFVMGESAPAGCCAGCGGWKITIEEQIPSREYEQSEGFEPVTVTLEKEVGVQEIYSGCRWTSVKREYGPGGVRRVRVGISAFMEEKYDVQNEL